MGQEASANTTNDKHNRKLESSPTDAIVDPTGRVSTATEIEITWIETTPMTPQEYHAAVDALAVLIARWWHTHPHHDRQQAA